MKKLLIIIAICMALLVGGCSSPMPPITPPEPEITSEEVMVEEIDNPEEDTPEIRGSAVVTTEAGEAVRRNIRFLDSRIDFWNPPGYSTTVPFRLENKTEYAQEFEVVSSIPIDTIDGNAIVPNSIEMFKTPEFITLVPGEILEVPVTITVPGDADVPEKWEHWVGVRAAIGNSRATAWLRIHINSQQS